MVLHGVEDLRAEAIDQRIDLEMCFFVKGGHAKLFPCHDVVHGVSDAPKIRSAGNSDE